MKYFCHDSPPSLVLIEGPLKTFRITDHDLVHNLNYIRWILYLQMDLVQKF